MDLAAQEGTGIRSASRGKVIFAGNRNDGYGNQIIIEHDGGYFTRYAHIKNGGLKVEVGKEVKNGEEIAEVGSTGTSTGPHLHFEIRKGGAWGEAIDPKTIEDLDLLIHGKYSKWDDTRLLTEVHWLDTRLEFLEGRYTRGKISEDVYKSKKERLTQKLLDLNSEMERRGITKSTDYDSDDCAEQPQDEQNTEIKEETPN